MPTTSLSKSIEDGLSARTLASRNANALPWLLFAGRVLMASLFVISGIRKIFEFDMFVAYMTAFGVPMPAALLPLATLLEIVAGAMLALGIGARWAAAALFLETWLLNGIFHRFWTFPAAQQPAQLNLFLFHLSTMGGLLYMMAYGAGPISLRLARTSVPRP
jgi:putative oxidoreductase